MEKTNWEESKNNEVFSTEDQTALDIVVVSKALWRWAVLSPLKTTEVVKGGI